MHQTKNSHLLKLLKDITENQLFFGQLVMNKNEIQARLNILIP